MSGPLAALLIIGAGLGGYAFYRHVEKSKEAPKASVRPGRGARVQTRGYFAGAGIYGVDYVNAADARSDRRPQSRLFLLKPYQIFNPGGGMRPYEMDAQGAPTGRELVLPGESSGSLAPGSFVLVGQGGSNPPDPRNCLCPRDITYFDPLNPKLPEYKCSCNTPGAVRPPYAGFYATGRAGRQHYQHRMRQRMQPALNGGDDDS